MIFFAEEKRLQKESLSQNKKHHMLLPNQNYNTTNNLLLGFQNILCYYQTFRVISPEPIQRISKHHMLLSNFRGRTAFLYFKTSYVTIKPPDTTPYNIFAPIFQNIICYYQTELAKGCLEDNFISKHHMLLSNCLGNLLNLLSARISKHHMLLSNPRF